MVSSSAVGQTASTLKIGSRVWLLHEGWSGRITAQAQGGLLYRVRREDAPAVVLVRPGCDLMALHDREPAEPN